MSAPIVSVVMSVFNGEPFLRTAVESILNQTMSEFEFIVINDGSIDDSEAILDSYRKADSRIRVTTQENRGLVESLNRGCALASGKYIARMDADDIAVCDRLQQQITFMDEHPDVGLLGGAIEYIDASGRVFRSCRHPLGDEAIRDAMDRLEGSFCHPATVMRKDIFKLAGGYRASFFGAEDYDLWLRIGGRSKLANLAEVVLQYRIHPGQISQKKLVQQGLSMLGARRNMMSGNQKEWKEIVSGSLITPEILTSHGVSMKEQQEALISRYRDGMNTLIYEGDFAEALALSESLFQSSRWECVSRSLKAHIWLMTASLYWRRREKLSSLLAAGRAFAIWPFIAGRPLKALLMRVSGTMTGRSLLEGER